MCVVVRLFSMTYYFRTFYSMVCFKSVLTSSENYLVIANTYSKTILNSEQITVWVGCKRGEMFII